MGPFNCPNMYCMAIIIPNVMFPSTTALAAKNETKTFFVWSMNNPPTCWVCPKVID